MTISQKGIEFIAEFEGFRSSPYLDSVGIPTIGYGTITYPNGKKVTMNDAPVTKEKALEYLKDHISKHVKINIDLNQAQYDAVTSFIYNLGMGAFNGSTLDKRIRTKVACNHIEEAFLMWNKARVNGKLTVLPGLTRRREREAKLFCTGIYK